MNEVYFIEIIGRLIGTYMDLFNTYTYLIPQKEFKSNTEIYIASLRFTHLFLIKVE